jgi:hypothetical protein
MVLLDSNIHAILQRDANSASHCNPFTSDNVKVLKAWLNDPSKTKEVGTELASGFLLDLKGKSVGPNHEQPKND